MISTANNPTLAAAMATAAKRRQEEPTALEAAPANLQALEAENARLRDEVAQNARTEARLLASNKRLTKEVSSLKAQAGKPPPPPPTFEGAKMDLRVTSIRRDGGTQSRAELNERTIERYAEAMRDGAQFPPIKVFHDGKAYWLADGFHRLAAAERAGIDLVRCDVLQGTQRDAIQHSTGANKQHDKAGLGRTNADKRLAVTRMLSDDEWGKWSDNKIAQWCGVSQQTVANYRKAIFQNLEDKATETPSDPHPSPLSLRARGEEGAQAATRMVTRGGTNYPMAVGRIGGQKAAPQTFTLRERNENGERVRVVVDEFAQRLPEDVPSVDVDSEADKMLDILTDAHGEITADKMLDNWPPDQAGENTLAQRKALLNAQAAQAVELADAPPAESGSLGLLHMLLKDTLRQIEGLRGGMDYRTVAYLDEICAKARTRAKQIIEG